MRMPDSMRGGAAPATRRPRNGENIMHILLKRAYEAPAEADGKRVLVDRLWPRGVSKDEARIDAWLKDVGPSTELRKWFGHEPAKFDEFRSRYRKELEASAAWAELKELARHGKLTLVYSARDEEHNNAVVLRQMLQEQARA